MTTRYKEMPKDDGYRSGCKVCWHYYRNKKTAIEAARIAQHNAAIQEDLGYDFGYCMPGNVVLVKDYKGEFAKFNGMWEVCAP